MRCGGEGGLKMYKSVSSRTVKRAATNVCWKYVGREGNDWVFEFEYSGIDVLDDGWDVSRFLKFCDFLECVRLNSFNFRPVYVWYIRCLDRAGIV